MRYQVPLWAYLSPRTFEEGVGAAGGGGAGGGGGFLTLSHTRVDSSATYSFSYTYCIKSRLILLYIPGQQADIGQLRVQMAFEILDQKIK